VTKGNFSAVVILGGPTLVIYRKYCEPLPVVMDICDDHAAFYRRWAAIERSAIRRIYLLIQAKLFTHALRRSAPLTAGCIFISTEDERTSRLPATARSAVIPNHVDPTLLERVKHPDTRSATRLLFVGAMGSYNNRDAVRWFAEHVLPLVTTAYPTAVFRVVGGACDQLDTACSNDGVEIVGYVDDLAAEYVSCDLFVCPLRSGAGIKNKVLEAMAAGCAVVTTSIGAEGLPCREGYDVMIADSALDFADAVVALISNAELRRQLGVNARHTVQANFAEESVQARWREFLKPLCTARR
jgi:glycosyltransferase involved in cell wall biosynthesis